MNIDYFGIRAIGRRFARSVTTVGSVASSRPIAGMRNKVVTKAAYLRTRITLGINRFTGGDTLSLILFVFFILLMTGVHSYELGLDQ